MKRFNLPKIVGRYGTFTVDTFSTLVFFAMQGRSWVLITTGLIFAAVKIWHWVRSFAAKIPSIRTLHRIAWGVMAVLSIYFLITLGVAITEPEPEQVAVVDETAETLAKAVAESKTARINALIQEQNLLLEQNASLAGQLSTFGQWSNAAADFRATINGNNERLGKIGDELKTLYDQTAEDARRETESEKETQKEKDNLMLASIRNFKPIGATALLERVMPKRFTGFAIRFLFFLIGVVMEITLALSSLPDEAGEKVKRLDRKHLKKGPSVRRPLLEDIVSYIESAFNDDRTLIPDDQIKGFVLHKALKIRQFLMSVSYQGKPLVSEKNGQFVSYFKKDDLKRFIEIQYDTKIEIPRLEIQGGAS
jgi:uncharacterized membrane protein YecN with MAPEG domain